VTFELNYEKMVLLDAESLAEGGIGRAYASLLPHLLKFVKEPAPVEDVVDDDLPSYSVRCGRKKFAIYGPELEEAGANSWGRATVALFAIVNNQLRSSKVRLYALYDGNDLGGMFLTPAQAKAARKLLPEKRDWPYLPKDEAPWYGRPH
jgi:hypothetical protein